VAAPRKYPDELRARAVRLYRESEPKPVIRRLAEQLGVHPEALRNWIRQDEADRGLRRDRLTTAELEELRRLRRENAELRRVNEILKAASAVFAQELDPTRRRS
jgi:transposase